LFDKVCVIYEGKMAYFGPADKAKQYFLDLGYEPVNRQTTPDFLVSVTDPNARIFRQGVLNQPRTSIEFAQHFRKSSLGQANREDIKSYKEDYVGLPDRAQSYQHSALAEHSKNTRRSSFVSHTLFFVGHMLTISCVCFPEPTRSPSPCRPEPSWCAEFKL
jgi:ATP-binding cassette subfamily G (WHITE) protein 2 (SNQ2)